jgi:outer membrane protein OmpA-like peptidoglycan-associated protein
MTRIWASALRRDAAWRAAILSGVLMAAPVLPAAAQTIVGGRTSPDVVVNESVLDSLGPPPTLPGLLRQENAAGGGPSGLRPFTLHPPRARRTAAAAKPKPPAEDQAQQTASAVSPTAIPLGKPNRTARRKSQPVEQASADIAATAPPPKSSAPPAPTPAAAPPQPPPSASAGTSAPPPAAAAPTAPAPASAVNSIVRRYPAGTGAATLAASQPPPSAPASQSAAPTPSASAAAPSPAPATAAVAEPSSTAAAPPQPAAPPNMPAPATTAQPTPPQVPAPQVASVPPGGGLPALPAVIAFAPNVTDMPDQAKATLDKVIAAMKADDQIRIQLVAYASGLPDQANAARRTSLQRAVSVRAYLVEQGVKSVRIDVRAMGNRTDAGGPQDRVDIVAQ